MLRGSTHPATFRSQIQVSYGKPCDHWILKLCHSNFSLTINPPTYSRNFQLQNIHPLTLFTFCHVTPTNVILCVELTQSSVQLWRGMKIIHSWRSLSQKSLTFTAACLYLHTYRECCPFFSAWHVKLSPIVQKEFVNRNSKALFEFSVHFELNPFMIPLTPCLGLLYHWKVNTDSLMSCFLYFFSL